MIWTERSLLAKVRRIGQVSYSHEQADFRGARHSMGVGSDPVRHVTEWGLTPFVMSQAGTW